MWHASRKNKIRGRVDKNSYMICICIYKCKYENSNVMYKCVGGPWVVFGLHDKEKRNINT